MATRDIVLHNEERLRKTSREVTDFNERLCILLDDMLETMYAKDGVGIAAPQVGVLRRAVICQMEDGSIRELINPVLMSKKGKAVMEEGCLSVPDYRCSVARPTYIKVKYQDRTGKSITEIFEGYDARVCCHEMDHLEGILFYDKEAK